MVFKDCENLKKKSLIEEKFFLKVIKLHKSKEIVWKKSCAKIYTEIESDLLIKFADFDILMISESVNLKNHKTLYWQ